MSKYSIKLSNELGYENKIKKIMKNFTERLSKCYTGVLHDIT